jgi:hypothetical protein
MQVVFLLPKHHPVQMAEREQSVTAKKNRKGVIAPKALVPFRKGPEFLWTRSKMLVPRMHRVKVPNRNTNRVLNKSVSVPMETNSENLRIKPRQSLCPSK